jgi:hypothetical protein
MAKKFFGSRRNSPEAKPSKSAPRASTPVRSSPVPKAQKRAITPEMIAERAYFIALSGTGGSEFDNWIRAERELRDM